MQRIAGVIAEYNPFHNGHAYHLARTKEVSGCAQIIVALSGSFVQRGEPAAFDKFQRARWALLHGADLVLELPTAFACASAERFARGGVALLAATGLISALAFGAEHADPALLQALAFPQVEKGEQRERLAFHLKRGLSYPTAYARAAGELDEEAQKAHALPNNILAVEYLRACKLLAPAIEPIAIARVGADHDAPAMDEQAGFASASALREAAEQHAFSLLYSAAPSDVAVQIEAACRAQSAPKNADALSGAILYALRMRTRAQLAELPDVAEGLEATLYEKARSCTGYSAFLSAVKTKRYTHARLRRIAMHALLGVDKSFFARHPAPRYLRVLGVKRSALPLLTKLTQSASLPVVTGYREYARLDAAAKEQFNLDLFAGELLAMASPTPEPAQNEFTRPLLIV